MDYSSLEIIPPSPNNQVNVSYHHFKVLRLLSSCPVFDLCLKILHRFILRPPPATVEMKAEILHTFLSCVHNRRLFRTELELQGTPTAHPTASDCIYHKSKVSIAAIQSSQGLSHLSTIKNVGRLICCVRDGYRNYPSAMAAMLI